MVIRTNGTQNESKIMEFVPRQATMLHYDVEYDTLRPEEEIKDFVRDIKGMVARFNDNKLRIFQIEEELNDLEHYMEIGKFKNVPEGYKLYRKLAELRRERRACKNENELLKPVYEHFYATEVLNKLTAVQGECSKVKSTIDARTYTVRTDILDEWLNPEKKEPENEPTLTTGGVTDAEESGDYVARKMLLECTEKRIDEELLNKGYSFG